MPYTGDGIGYQKTDTSYAAAEGVKESAKTLRTRVLRHLRDFPFPLSADEVAADLRVSILSIRPRFTELRAAGLIEDSGSRGLNRSGKSCILWKPTKKKELNE